MVMKNRPSSTSWNGRMSVSTWCLYSVSAISMPATKAPSASDRPASSVSQARPSVTSSRLRTNSSSLLRRATSVSHQRITRWPPTSSTRQQHAGLQRSAIASAREQRLGRRAERRDQHQQRHHGQILEQQHAHHAPAVLALELEPLGHQLDDDRGRLLIASARAERDRALPAEPQARPARAKPAPAAALPATAASDRQHHLAAGRGRTPACACCAAWAG